MYPYHQGNQNPRYVAPFVYIPHYGPAVYPNIPIDQQQWIPPPPYVNPPPVANGRPAEGDEGESGNHEEERHSNYGPPPGFLPPGQPQSVCQMFPVNIHSYLSPAVPYAPMYGSGGPNEPPVEVSQNNGTRRTKTNKTGVTTDKSPESNQYPESETNGDVTSSVSQAASSVSYQPQHPGNYMNMTYSPVPYPYSYYPPAVAHMSAQHATGSPIYMPVYHAPVFASGPIYPPDSASVGIPVPIQLPGSEECKVEDQTDEEFSSLKITDYVEEEQNTDEDYMQKTNTYDDIPEDPSEETSPTSLATTEQTYVESNTENQVIYNKQTKDPCLIDPAIILSSAPVNQPIEIKKEIEVTTEMVTIAEKIEKVKVTVENDTEQKADAEILVNGFDNSVSDEDKDAGSTNNDEKPKDIEPERKPSDKKSKKQHVKDEKPEMVKKEATAEPDTTEVKQKDEEKEDASAEKEPEPEVSTVRTWAGLFKENYIPKKHAAQSASSAVNVSSKMPQNRPEPSHTAPNENCFEVTNNVNLPSFKTSGRHSKKSSSGVNSPSPISLDEIGLRKIGEFLKSYKQDNRAQNFETHGLINRGNYCYINATLQALMACAPFYNFLKSLSGNVQRNRGRSSSLKQYAPVLDSLIQLVNEYSVIHAKIKKEQIKKYEGIRELTNISSFEPTFMYKTLSSLRDANGAFVLGQQEDAQEFLTFLLNTVNDEMVALMQLAEGATLAQLQDLKGTTGKKTGEKVTPHKPISNGVVGFEGDDGAEWKEVQAKNRAVIVHRQDLRPTPLADIFRGQTRSCLKKAGDLSTNNIEPFFMLHLNIEKVHSVREALDLLVGRDMVEGYTSSRTNQEIDAWQQQTLEKLPVVLILHLKCFDYRNHSCSKIIKPIDFPIDLRFESKAMSSAVTRNKSSQYANRNRQYKLFAVVYHDGKEATKGHYITDVFHVGHGWIRYDDSRVYTVEEKDVLKPQLPRMPYMLYYRRQDTIAALNQPPFNKSS